MSKFSDIAFPFFGLSHAPKEVKYSETKIEITTHDNLKWIVDDKSVYKDLNYLERLFKLRELDETHHNIIKYDFTANNLQQLVVSKEIKWGLDITGKIHDLSRKEKFPVIYRKIEKTKNNFIWVEKISYPFEIKYDLIEAITPYMIVTLVKVERDWYIYDIGYNYEQKKEIYV